MRLRKLTMALGMAAILVTGCKTPNPCETLAPPTPNELAVVASGAEVEREIRGAECDLVNGSWDREPEGKGK